MILILLEEEWYSFQDFENASFTHIMSMMRGSGNVDMKKLMEWMQNHLPGRIRGMWIVNAPWWMRLALALWRPMMKPKMRKKMQLLDASNLGDFFTPEHLPTMYGGQFNLNIDWLEPLLEARPNISHGLYIDPSPRSDSLVLSYTGSEDAEAEPHPDIVEA